MSCRQDSQAITAVGSGKVDTCMLLGISDILHGCRELVTGGVGPVVAIQPACRPLLVVSSAPGSKQQGSC